MLTGGRGYVPIHASCVVREGRGIILQAPAGTGKSTLALACATRGWGLLAEDVVFARPVDGAGGDAELEVWGVPWTQRLLADAPRFFPELAATSARLQANGEHKLEVDLDLHAPGRATPRALAGPVALLARDTGRPDPRRVGSDPGRRERPRSRSSGPGRVAGARPTTGRPAASSTTASCASISTRPLTRPWPPSRPRWSPARAARRGAPSGTRAGAARNPDAAAGVPAPPTSLLRGHPSMRRSSHRARAPEPHIVRRRPPPDGSPRRRLHLGDALAQPGADAQPARPAPRWASASGRRRSRRCPRSRPSPGRRRWSSPTTWWPSSRARSR